jgi:hypothetical protein
MFLSLNMAIPMRFVTGGEIAIMAIVKNVLFG